MKLLWVVVFFREVVGSVAKLVRKTRNDENQQNKKISKNAKETRNRLAHGKQLPFPYGISRPYRCIDFMCLNIHHYQVDMFYVRVGSDIIQCVYSDSVFHICFAFRHISTLSINLLYRLSSAATALLLLTPILRTVIILSKPSFSDILSLIRLILPGLVSSEITYLALVAAKSV